MRKISTKIIVSIVAFCILTSSIITFSLNILSKNTIQSEAETNLLKTAQNTAQNINDGLDSTKLNVDSISTLVSSTFDYTQSSNEAYVNTFISSLTPFMESLINDQKNLLGVALFINPEITESMHQIVFERNSDTKKISQLNKFKKDDFYENNPDMSWYYNPIKSKQGDICSPMTILIIGRLSLEISFNKFIYVFITIFI